MRAAIVNQIVSVGSVDGVCTSAALLHYLGEANVGLEFCQAFTVDKVDPSTWLPNRKVALIDLAVNNRDESMTVDFIRRIHDLGHDIVAIIDEHDAVAWNRIVNAVFDANIEDMVLWIKPVSQCHGVVHSSGALLLLELSKALDDQSKELCRAADAADRMDFSTHFGGLVNRAVKSSIGDDSRRVYLARHFADHHGPDETISNWIAEYDVILSNHDKIVDAAQDLGKKIVRVSTIGMAVDMTTLMRRLYHDYRIVFLDGEAFNKSIGYKVRQIAIGCNPDIDLDVLGALRQADIPCSGFAAKANIQLEHEDAALRVLMSMC